MANPDGDRDAGLADLERRFDAAMMEIYERAGREVGYWATRYLQMLRARGGLGTARRLLNARATSDGYARLRSAGRLDLTVEAYALHAEFQALFTPDELDLARDRLEYFGRQVGPSEAHRGSAPARTMDPELARLLEVAAKAPPDHRVDYRDGIAGFGFAAIPAMEAWVDGGGSPGFACAVLEAAARTADPSAAVRALRQLRARQPSWASVIDPAIARVDVARRTVAHAAARPAESDVYVASGTPPPAYGPCEVLNRDGSMCQNPGRHLVGSVLRCTTHFKAATRRGAPF